MFLFRRELSFSLTLLVWDLWMFTSIRPILWSWNFILWKWGFYNPKIGRLYSENWKFIIQNLKVYNPKTGNLFSEYLKSLPRKSGVYTPKIGSLYSENQEFWHFAGSFFFIGTGHFVLQALIVLQQCCTLSVSRTRVGWLPCGRDASADSFVLSLFTQYFESCAVLITFFRTSSGKTDLSKHPFTLNTVLRRQQTEKRNRILFFSISNEKVSCFHTSLLVYR